MSGMTLGQRVGDCPPYKFRTDCWLLDGNKSAESEPERALARLAKPALPPPARASSCPLPRRKLSDRHALGFNQATLDKGSTMTAHIRNDYH